MVDVVRIGSGVPRIPIRRADDLVDRIEALKKEAAARGFGTLAYFLYGFDRGQVARTAHHRGHGCRASQTQRALAPYRGSGLMAEPADLPEIDLDVADVNRIALTTDPQGETMISFEMASGQVMNLVFLPEIFAKLEAMLAKANERRLRLYRSSRAAVDVPSRAQWVHHQHARCRAGAPDPAFV